METNRPAQLPFVASFARNPHLATAWMGQPGEWVDYPDFPHTRATFDTGTQHGPDATECAVCGSRPAGFGCYHICPNSVAYYTPEQEREDDANWDRGAWLREMYGDPGLDADDRDWLREAYGDPDVDAGDQRATAPAHDFDSIPF